MPKRYTSRQVLKALKSAGFGVVSQKESHIKLHGVIGSKLQTVIVPNHPQIAQRTFLSILAQANLSKEEFEELLKK